MKIDWIEIPAAEFLMGLSNDQLKSLVGKVPFNVVDLESEKMSRVVQLDTFWIARTPITFAQFNEFVDTNHPYADPWGRRRASNFKEYPMDHPEDVIWHNAVAFCDWVGGRLPTAAEWEKAARGIDGRLYPWGNKWDRTRGNFARVMTAPHVLGRWTTPVDAYPKGASPYGVLDMMGNVREWTLTFENDPRSKKEGPVVKGSCAEDDNMPEQAAHRVTRHRLGSLIPNLAPAYTGFRPVIDKWQKQLWPGFNAIDRS
jgi:formylglycine-generating enzyme required for sulfatase activity